MARPVRFAFAHDAQLRVVHVHEASKLIDYTCRECGKPVLFCDGERNRSYFRHKTREWLPDEHCDYGDETYAHRQAKAILQQQRWVKVPAVLPRRAEGYEGKLRPLREVRVVEAAGVYLERTMYEDAACGLNFYRQQRPFVEEPGRRDFICKPDVLFTDARDRPILLIEILVTHAVGYKKLVGLRRAQIDTIEITIPAWYNARQIADLLNSVQHTKWLYNHERETTPAVGADAATAAALRGNGADEIPAPGPESDECQLHEIREAVRSLKKFMAGAAVGAALARLADAGSELTAAASREAGEFAAELARAQRELQQEFAAEEASITATEAELAADQTATTRLFNLDKARVEGQIRAVDIDLGAAYRATAAELSKRVAARRAAYRQAEYAVAASRGRLSDQLAAAQAPFTQRFRAAAEALERRAAERTSETAAAAAAEQAIQERLTRLAGYLESRCQRAGNELQRKINVLAAGEPERQRLRAKLRHLDQQTATADREERELRAEESAVGSQEAVAARQLAARAADELNEQTRGDALRAAYQRAAAAVAEELRAVEAGITRIGAVRRQLIRIKDAALDRRTARQQPISGD